MTELQKFNKWFNTTEYAGSMRPYLWAAWMAWYEGFDNAE